MLNDIGFRVLKMIGFGEFKMIEASCVKKISGFLPSK